MLVYNNTGGPELAVVPEQPDDTPDDEWKREEWRIYVIGRARAYVPEDFPGIHPDNITHVMLAMAAILGAVKEGEMSVVHMLQVCLTEMQERDALAPAFMAGPVSAAGTSCLLPWHFPTIRDTHFCPSAS